MALVPVIEGSGDLITDWYGNLLSLESDGKVIAVATPELHAKALSILHN